jgi:hypothetical protein
MRENTVESVGQQRAGWATGLLTGPEHEVIDQELTAPLEKIGESFPAGGRIETILVADFDPGKRLTFPVDPVPQMNELFLFGEERFAGDQPFLFRYNGVLHIGGLLLLS